MFLLLIIVHSFTLKVVCHLDKEGGAHPIVLSIERGKSQEECVMNVCLTGPVQKKITTTTNNTKNMYVMKMFRT